MNESSEENGSSGVALCVLICATVAFVAYLALRPRVEQTRRLWVPVVVETNDNQTILGETRQLEFWTPSAKTKDYLKPNGRTVGDPEKWQILPNDDPVIQFGSVLHSNTSVFGYRRVEEWGQGRTSFKPGWWWTMNVSTNYSVVELARTYHQYWHCAQPLLIEVIDNRGSSVTSD
jgi:hypothetical protein